jgi:hypothetical protein
MSSLPVPLSPVNKTVACDGAICSTIRQMRCRPGSTDHLGA